MDKSLGTLLHFCGVFQLTQVQPFPSPHKQFWTRVSRILSEFQLCVGWGEKKLQENFEKDGRNDRKMWILQYCPKDFVQDCSLWKWRIERFHPRDQYANLLERKKALALEKSSTPIRLVWDTNMAAVSLFWDTNMAVKSCENTLFRMWMVVVTFSKLASH